MIESLAHVASEIAKTKTEVSEASHFDSRAELSKGDVARNNPDTRALVRGKYPEDATYEIKNGQKHYFDVNQRLYRVDKNLVPNNSYELNGYKYKTDDQGRISSVTGKLHLKERQGRLPIEDSLNDIGKGDEHATRDAMGRPMDDKGHLIGDQFGGAPRMENLIPQDAKINQGIYKSLEDQLAKQVKNGKDVHSEIKPIYEGASWRPTSLVYKYSIDGAKFLKIFPNDRSGL